ncbi:branched-chain amino acid ABC transporter permease [Actinomadura mexicana]|uniref:Amino acid/amide ABC transporter membrane protein 1, HAAT family n=1 Tax=Actinomadura mexicana TaxID=134959 RepID=A0A238XEJ4_9ACTN|nr:branched-chain amino acid ABC transporter permease [Actinomadura mexicana]SNR56754.1 amino acid/amide ABC transporter membrane protein 1, HAAT family [Actinomadura mexicana]
MTALVQHVLDALSVGSTYALLALGLTLVFSVMNLINFAYGLLLVCGGYAACVLVDAGLPFALVVPLCVLFVTLLSMAMGRVAFRPFIGAPPITLLITSFGVLLIIQYIAILIFGEKPRVLNAPDFLTGVIAAGGLRVPVLQVVTIASGAIVAAAFYGLLHRTPFGAQLRAAAESPETARLMGIRPDRVLMIAFAISGAIAGVVGLLWFAKVGAVTPRSDLEPTLKAFIAIVLGGLGRASGAMLGGLALGGIEVTMTVVLPSGAITYAQAIVFAVVIALLVLRPGGLSGARTEAA